MENERYFQVNVTRDTTESTLIPIKAASFTEAGELATYVQKAAAFSNRFITNDNGDLEKPYLGDPDEDVEEITRELYESLLDTAQKQVYTVFCLYPDHSTGDFGADIFVESADATDGHDAAKQVQKKAADANEDIDPDDFRVIAVLRGEHHLVLDATGFEMKGVIV